MPSHFLEAAQDDATLLAIRDQERAGIDIVTDGEMRRESYSNRFATALEGVDIDNPGMAPARTPGKFQPVPRVVGPIRRKHAGRSARLCEFLRANTDRPIKITVPGPFTMAQQAQDDHYKDEAALAMAYAAAVNEEIKDLFAAGADVVQIDEPYMQSRARQGGALRRRGARTARSTASAARPPSISVSATPPSCSSARRAIRSWRSSNARASGRSRSRPRSRSSIARS